VKLVTDFPKKWNREIDFSNRESWRIFREYHCCSREFILGAPVDEESKMRRLQIAEWYRDQVNLTVPNSGKNQNILYVWDCKAYIYVKPEASDLI